MEPADKGREPSFTTTAVPSEERPAPVLPSRRRPSKVIIMVLLVLVVVGGVFTGPQLWFSIQTPVLPLTQFDVPHAWSMIYFPMHLLNPAPDGSVWFLPGAGSWIGHLTSRGTFTRFPLVVPNQDNYFVPWTNFQRSADGMLWANGIGEQDLWRFDPRTGTSRNYPYVFEDMTIAHDSSAWYSDSVTLGNSLGHRNLRTGQLHAYPVNPGQGSLTCCAQGITETADGMIWFVVSPTPSLDGTGPGHTGVMRLDPSTGALTFFPLTAFAFNGFVGLTPAADRGIWFECGTSFPMRALIHLSPTGVVTRYDPPNQGDLLAFALASNDEPWMIYREPHPWFTSPYVLARGEPGGSVIPMGRITRTEPHAMTFGLHHQMWVATAQSLERVDLPG